MGDSASLDSEDPRSTAAQVTSPACASRSKRSARWTSRSGSLWRLLWGWASTRSLTSARRAEGALAARSAAGRALAAFGLTEAEAGSDAGATRTRATLRDHEWVINGSKQFITNSGTDISAVCTITARTGTRDNGKPEISAIVVPTGTPASWSVPAM